MKKIKISIDNFILLCLCVCSFSLALVSHKYLILKKTYKIECQEKMKYCKSYYELLDADISLIIRDIEKKK